MSTTQTQQAALLFQQRASADSPIAPVHTRKRMLHEPQMKNQVCPYTSAPVSTIITTRERIVPAALGGPAGFSLAVEAQCASRFESTIDSRLTQTPLLGMLATGAGVKTKSSSVASQAPGGDAQDCAGLGSLGPEPDLFAITQGLTKIAYMATVWTLGDDFITSRAGAQYRSWINAEPNHASFEAVGLHSMGVSLFKEEVPPSHHLIACVVLEGKLLTGVRLFNEPLFEITLAITVPGLHLANRHGLHIRIDAKRRTFEEKLLLP